MSFNPYVAKSTSGQVAYAILLPVKIDHNEEGEIWLLPSGEKVFKVGGEAPPRTFSDGIEISGSTLKSSAVSVDLQSVVESEIIYKNGTDYIAKENWFIYEKDQKIDWGSITDQNIFINSVPVSEKVGAFTVTDYEKEAVKERILNNIFGSLFIEYKIHEGRPLKHTLNFTAVNDGTFKLCQEFSDIEYDNLVKFDDDNKTIESLDIIVSPTEKTDVKSVDSLSLTKEEKGTQKILTQLSLPELVEFKKDGKLVLAEITSGAKDDFQSFEYDSFTNTAKFCYGDFTLKSGESFLIDPDTYSSNNPTQDGYIESDTDASTSCTAVGLYTRFSTANAFTIQRASSGNAGAECALAYIEWPTSSITDTATITDVDITLDYGALDQPTVCDYTPMTTQPSVAAASDVWTDILDGTPYVSSSTSCQTVSDNVSVDLGTSGDSDLQNGLTSDRFSVGIRFTDMVRDGTTRYTQIISEEGVSPTPSPTLSVTYSTEVDTTVTINHYTGNTTALTTCNITQTNSSTSSTKACGSSGIQVFTGISGNQNFTVKETTTNFVVNKTRNFSPSTNLIINATIVPVNCVQTGSSADIRLWFNQTDGHTFTNFTRPACTTSNQQVPVISWNVTASPDGKNSATFNSDLRVEILNVTAFGKNALAFYHNGKTNTTSYSNGVLTSSDFPIGSGIGSSTLRKFYLWLDPKPDVPTSVSGTGASVSQINLSWTAPNSGVSSITGYRIYRGTDGVNFPTLVSSDTGSTTTSYSDTGLLVNTTYYYKIAGINSYGVGNNSTAGTGATQSASGGSSGSGSGGGGGSFYPPVSQSSFSTLSLIPKKLVLVPSQTTTGEISLTWNSGSDLLIKSVNYGKTDFILSFTVPTTLKGSADSISSNKITYNIVAPKDLKLNSYSIPFTITAELNGSTVTQQGTIIVDRLGDVNLNLVIIMAIIGFTGSVFVYRRLGNKKSNKSKDGTLMKEIKGIERQFEKPLKNGTMLKELKKLRKLDI